jgi:hypothetical protein
VIETASLAAHCRSPFVRGSVILAHDVPHPFQSNGTAGSEILNNLLSCRFRMSLQYLTDADPSVGPAIYAPPHGPVRGTATQYPPLTTPARDQTSFNLGSQLRERSSRASGPVRDGFGTQRWTRTRDGARGFGSRYDRVRHSNESRCMSDLTWVTCDGAPTYCSQRNACRCGKAPADCQRAVIVAGLGNVVK